MRDGVILRRHLRPNAEGKFPSSFSAGTTTNPRFGLSLYGSRRGYIATFRNTRGALPRGIYPFRDEANDGYDTVEWAAALPYSNGKVGMWAHSYVRFQLLPRLPIPRSLPHLPGGDRQHYHDGWTYQGGAFEQAFNEA